MASNKSVQKTNEAMRTRISAFLQDLNTYRTNSGTTSFSEINSGEGFHPDVLVLHRILNKLEIPDPSGASIRREQSLRACLEYDRACTFEVANAWADERVRLATARLTTWSAGFKPSYAFTPPSGESQASRHGDVDVMSKLSDLSAWEVSVEALPYATKIAWHNQWLKRVVKRLWKQTYPASLLDSFRDSCPIDTHLGYWCFAKMFRSLVTICGYSRMTTVPKDNGKDRVITCEPFWNMVCQLSLMYDIRRHFRRKTGVWLDRAQDVHRTLIANRCSTIDLRNASNSIWNDLVQRMWRGRLGALIQQLRTPHTVCHLPTDPEADADGNVWHYFSMFSPMGCGLTFDVMTFTLLALGRSVDPSTQVFGDDIICSNNHASELIELLNLCGVQINPTKTFVGGSFRESCGAFYHENYGYLTSFDFVYPDNMSDYMMLGNKAAVIALAGQVSPELQRLLLEFSEAVAMLAPREFRWGGPARLLEGAISYWEDESVRQPVVAQLLAEQLHRRALTRSRLRAVTSTVEPSNGFIETACFFLAMRSYRPSVKGDTRFVKDVCDVVSGSPIRDFVLVSVLD